MMVTFSQIYLAYPELGADHALKQANKSIKTHGGIKGIVNNQLA